MEPTDDLGTNVPGLKDVREATDELAAAVDRQRSGLRRMMADEQNDGASPPPPSDPAALESRLAAMREQYPRAAAYWDYERDSRKAHGISRAALAAGRAMEALARGEPLDAAAKIAQAGHGFFG